MMDQNMITNIIMMNLLEDNINNIIIGNKIQMKIQSILSEILQNMYIF